MAKELSMSKLDKAMKLCSKPEIGVLRYGDDASPIDIEVKHTISVEELENLVVATVSNLFRGNDSGDDIYCPEFYDISLAANILGSFTNLKSELGHDRLIKLAYETDIFDAVKEKISAKQYAAIVRSIDQRVAFLCGMMHAEQAAKLKELVEQFEKATAAFMTINESLSDIDPELYQRAVENIGMMKPDDFVEPVLRLVKNDEHTE